MFIFGVFVVIFKNVLFNSNVNLNFWMVLDHSKISPQNFGLTNYLDVILHCLIKGKALKTPNVP